MEQIDIFLDYTITLKANVPQAVSLPEDFKITETAFTLKHGSESGKLTASIMNGQGFAMQQDFQITPGLPVVITFEQNLISNDVPMNDVDFSDIQLTSNVDLEGWISYSKGYNPDYLELLKGQYLK